MNDNSTSIKSNGSLPSAGASQMPLAIDIEQLDLLIVDYEAKVLELSENRDTAMRRLAYLNKERKHLQLKLDWGYADTYISLP